MQIDIIGVPVDLGASRRGVDMGPAAIRYSGLHDAIQRMGHTCQDLGNIPVPVEDLPVENAQARYLSAIAEINQKLAHVVANSLAAGHLSVVLGGDHSLAAGSILGTQHVFHNTGVLWIDAHGDFNNEETTLSGNLHGMSLAAVTGSGVADMVSFKDPLDDYIHPKNVAIVGARSIDAAEAALLRKRGVHVFTMEDIDLHGLKHVMQEALKVVEHGTDAVHVSFDIDVITPAEAPGVGTPVQGGLTYREAHLVAELVAGCKKLKTIDMVELNPILDNANRTGELAVSLICSMLGRRIF